MGGRHLPPAWVLSMTIAYTGLSLVDEPGSDPVSLDQVKAQIHLTTGHHDAWLTDAIDAAVREVERLTQSAIISQQWDVFFDRFPATGGIIELPKPPLSAVDSITYIDGAGSVQTLSASQYIVDTTSERGRVWEAYGETWPATRAIRKAVTVRMTCGFSTADAVPPNLRHAVKMLVAHWFNNRDTVSKDSQNEVPFGVHSLLSGHESRRFF